MICTCTVVEEQHRGREQKNRRTEEKETDQEKKRRDQKKSREKNTPSFDSALELNGDLLVMTGQQDRNLEAGSAYRDSMVCVSGD